MCKTKNLKYNSRADWKLRILVKEKNSVAIETEIKRSENFAEHTFYWFLCEYIICTLNMIVLWITKLITNFN